MEESQNDSLSNSIGTLEKPPDGTSLDEANNGINNVEQIEGANINTEIIMPTTHDCGNNTEIESSNGSSSGTVKMCENELSVLPNSAKSTLLPSMFSLSNGSLCSEFRLDQIRENNFTDLDIICCDGFVQVHRCLLMGASKFLRELLIERDIMDTTAITLPDVSVRHLTQILALLYCGKTLINKCEEAILFNIMTMLGFPVNDFWCRIAKEHDVKQVTVPRFIPNSECNDDETNENTEKNEEQSCEVGAVQDENLENGNTGNPEEIQEQFVDDETEVNDVQQELSHHIIRVKDENDSSDPNQDIAMPMNDYQNQNVHDFMCPKCRLIQLSENDLLRHWHNSESCSKGTLEWINMDERKCSLCQYENPREETVRTLFDHVLDCVNISITHTKTITSASDLSFEEACSSLEQQMACQAEHIIKKREKRMVDDSEALDSSRSLSSRSSSSSSSQSKKRRKLTPVSLEATDVKNESFDQFIERLGHPSNNAYSNIDSDIIRKKFDIADQKDIHKLSAESLRLIFQQCPLCKFKHLKMKKASKCLRHHGYRICWVCFLLLPVSGNSFEEHTRSEHLRTDDGKVTCPLCLKEFEGTIGLPTHMGNYHYPRIMETVAEIICDEASELPIEKPVLVETNSLASDVYEKESSEVIHPKDIVVTHNTDDTISVSTSKIEEEGNGYDEDCSKGNTASPFQCTTTVPPAIANSMEELSEIVKSCQICKRCYHFSESATKCLKNHGYKRCWSCMKVFLIADISKHVETTHSLPGKPTIVECFLCLNPYAYNKGLNLHIGKHLALYDRQMGIKPMKRKNNVNKIKNIGSGNPEDSTGDTELIESKNIRRGKLVNTIRRRAKLKKKGVLPKKKTGIASRKSKRNTGKVQIADAFVPKSEISTDVPAVAKDDVLNIDKKELSVNQLTNIDRVGKCDLDAKQGLATQMSRVFLEVKEINGIEYNIYGLMDPIKGFQSGKTIAVMVSCDKNISGGKTSLTGV